MFALTMIELPLYSLVLCFLLERSGRSMAVAIAFHAGGHLDHIEHASRAQLGLHGLDVAVLAIVGVWAARALTRERGVVARRPQAA